MAFIDLNQVSDSKGFRICNIVFQVRSGAHAIAVKLLINVCFMVNPQAGICTVYMGGQWSPARIKLAFMYLYFTIQVIVNYQAAAGAQIRRWKNGRSGYEQGDATGIGVQDPVVQECPD
jgi:hypothetical protein